MSDINKRWNLIGFNFTNTSNYSYDQYRHCAIHKGIRLLPDKEDKDMLFCPSCGCRYPVKDTVEEQNIESNLPASNTNSGPKIFSAKPNRKYYDNFGALIDDPDIQNLARTG